MTKSKSLLAIALAASTLAIGSLATAGEAEAKSWKGGWKGGHHFKWHGHRWHGRHYFAKHYNFYQPCYFVKKPWGQLVKVCPHYRYY
jgi:hypothetical protein